MAKVLVLFSYWKEIVIVCIFSMMMLLLLFGGVSPTPSSSPLTTSSAVQRWEPVIRNAVKAEGVDEQYVPILLAITMQESGGMAADVMQSSESAGWAPGTIIDPVASITQGVRHWKRMLEIANSLGITDLATIVQSYNYGPGWLYYINNYGKVGTEESRQAFSAQHTTMKECGWRSPYCYGDYTYAVKVMRYVDQSGNAYVKALEEALKYKGWPYSWGGETPSTSFDCSGLLKWSFAAAGIVLPRTAQEQYQYTMRITERELRPGDLVFFTGTSNHALISHVGLYVGDQMMYNSNSNGVEYSSLRNPIWQEKIYGYGRIPIGGRR